MINTRLFASALGAARVIPNQNSFMTKNDFVKASRGEFSKTQQINYSTVLPRLLQMAHDCELVLSGVLTGRISLPNTTAPT